MFMHFLRGTMANAAVAGENPFKLVGQQFFHGAGLFHPGIPADIAERGEGFVFGRPCEMIPGEQDFLAIEKYLMAARVSGRGDELEIAVDPQGSRSCDDALDAAGCSAVRFVHDTGAMEVRGKFGVIGDIVAVREEHEIYAAHFLDALCEGIVEAR